MERLAIFGLAAMICFLSFGSDKPWVNAPQKQELVQPGIDKPWVTAPPKQELVQPGIDKPWVNPPAVPPVPVPTGIE